MIGHPKATGERTEAIILAELVKHGHIVLTPFGDNQRFDLVLYENKKFIRAQCKTGTWRNGCIVFNTCSTYSNYLGVTTKDYHGDVDIFLVYSNYTDKVYRVPMTVIGSSSTTLRVDVPKRRFDTINWAKDYEI